MVNRLLLCIVLLLVLVQSTWASVTTRCEIHVYNNTSHNSPGVFTLKNNAGADESGLGGPGGAAWVGSGTPTGIEGSMASATLGPYTAGDSYHWRFQAQPGTPISPDMIVAIGSSGVFDWDMSGNTITNSSPQTYTNYTFTLSNNMVTPAIAKWTYNGVVVKQEILQPGGSDVYTTPNVGVYPFADSFTMNSTLTSQAPLMTQNSDGTYSFGNVTESGTGGGTGNSTTYSYSGGSTAGTGIGGAAVTNSGGGYNITGGNPVISTTTNSLNFGTPSGAASESTLERFANQNHTDLGNIQNGQSALHTDLANQSYVFQTVTNQMGQLVSLMASNVFTDGQWLPRIYGAVTNSSSSNATPNISFTNNIVITNGQSGSNVFVLNQPNYSNVLAQIETNTRPNTNVLAGTNMLSLVPETATNAAAATAAATALLGGPLGNIQAVIDGIDQAPDFPDPAPFMTIEFAGHSYNCDPATRFPEVCAFSIAIFEFLISVWYIWSVGKLYLKTIDTFASVQTGGVPDMEATLPSGLGGNVAGIILATIVPNVLIALWVIVVTFVITDVFSVLGYITALHGAFAAVGSASSGGAVGVHLLLTFFPVAFFIHCLLARVVLEYTISHAQLIAVVASKFIWGK
jgi:hypothetical protein